MEGLLRFTGAAKRDPEIATWLAGQPSELRALARIDPSMRVGAVSVPHGHQGANVNLLTSKDDIDLITGMARYSGIPVSVHPGEGTNDTMETVL